MNEKTIHDYMEQTTEYYFLELKREKQSLWGNNFSLFEILDNPQKFKGGTDNHCLVLRSDYIDDLVEMYKRFLELQEKEGTDYELF